MDAFVRKLLCAMGLLYDAALSSGCDEPPSASLTFETTSERNHFERAMKAGCDGYLLAAATDERRRPPHEYQFNGIILKLLVKETR